MSLRRLRILAVGAALACALVALPGTAGASYPGTNGVIAFVQQQSRIGYCCWYVIATVGSGGGQVTQLTDPTLGGVTGADENPVYSPDGTKIAFRRYIPGLVLGLFVMNADGSNQHQITNGPDDEPTWSPDGSQIAFSSSRDNPAVDIYVVNSDGSGVVHRLTTDGGNTQPAWSPDGTKIAFSHYYRSQPNEVDQRDVYVMNADGTNPVDITNDGDWNEQDPAWSPDGKVIAYSSDKGDVDSSHIFKIASDGSGPVAQLTSGSLVDDTSPAWSPDGGEIVFDSDRGSGFPDIWRMLADGGGPIQLTSRSAVPNPENYHPDWQPVPPEATIRVGAATTPANDGGQFELLLDQTVVVPIAANGDSGFLYEQAGTYTVSEQGAGGTSLAEYSSSVACTVNGNAGPSGSGTSLQVTAAPGDSIDCTFTNVRKPTTITLASALAPSGDPGRFDLLLGNTVLVPAAGDGDSGSLPVAPGTYRLGERPTGGTAAADYTSSYACTVDGAPGAAGKGTSVRIAILANQQVACTFTNARKATVTLSKTLVPSTDPGRFDLLVGAKVVTAAAGDGDSGSLEVAPGAITVRETASASSPTALADYASSIACTVDGAPGPSGSGAALHLTAAAGDQIACTFTNARKATITVAMTLIPPDDPGRFDLRLVPGGLVKAAAGDGDSGTKLVAPGAYLVKETPVAGTSFALYATSLNCVLNGVPMAPGGRFMTVTVAAADQLVCTYIDLRR